MKKSFSILAAAAALLSACTTASQPTYTVPDPQDVVMYQVNPRVFAPDHSFLAVAEQLDKIQDLGVNVVWFMPIYEIGQLNSVNSPYCIKDYTGVNPEFGTVEEFKYAVAECHKRGMSVIIDWVANHTSWDNAWIENKDWYTQDEEGNIISPAGTGWLDVADLNFDNPEMCQAMIDAMKFWVLEVGVDGFRCDAADFVPYEFWKNCVDQLRAIPDHKLLMLAEGARKDHFDAGFEMNYAWHYLATLRRVFGNFGPSTGVDMSDPRYSNVNAASLIEVDEQEYDGVPAGCVKLRFITNHDEAVNDSPIADFHGAQGSLAAFVAATFIRGGALVYGSQEVGYPGKIDFFRYVPVDWNSNPEIRAEYTRLLGLINEHPAIRKGEVIAYPDENVLMFDRKFEDDQVFVAVNTKGEEITVPNPHGGDALTLGAYEYVIVTE